MTTDDKLDLILARLDQQDDRFTQIDKRFEQIDKRFEQIDKRFERAEQQRRDDLTYIERRFNEMDRKIDDIRNELRDEKRKLDEVYDARNRVTVNFTRAFAVGNASFAALIALVISLFIAGQK